MKNILLNYNNYSLSWKINLRFMVYKIPFAIWLVVVVVCFWGNFHFYFSHINFRKDIACEQWFRSFHVFCLNQERRNEIFHFFERESNPQSVALTVTRLRHNLYYLFLYASIVILLNNFQFKSRQFFCLQQAYYVW